MYFIVFNAMVTRIISSKKMITNHLIKNQIMMIKMILMMIKIIMIYYEA